MLSRADDTDAVHTAGPQVIWAGSWVADPPTCFQDPWALWGVLDEKMEYQGEVSTEPWRRHAVLWEFHEARAAVYRHTRCVWRVWLPSALGSIAPASPSFVRLCRSSVFLKRRPVVRSVDGSPRATGALSVPALGSPWGVQTLRENGCQVGFG